MWKPVKRYKDIKPGMRLRITTTLPGRRPEVNEVLVVERKRTTLRLQALSMRNTIEHVTMADWNFEHLWKVEAWH